MDDEVDFREAIDARFYEEDDHDGDEDDLSALAAAFEAPCVDCAWACVSQRNARCAAWLPGASSQCRGMPPPHVKPKTKMSNWQFDRHCLPCNNRLLGWRGRHLRLVQSSQHLLRLRPDPPRHPCLLASASEAAHWGQRPHSNVCRAWHHSLHRCSWAQDAWCRNVVQSWAHCNPCPPSWLPSTRRTGARQQATRRPSPTKRPSDPPCPPQVRVRGLAPRRHREPARLTRCRSVPYSGRWPAATRPHVPL